MSLQFLLEIYYEMMIYFKSIIDKYLFENIFCL